MQFIKETCYPYPFYEPNGPLITYAVKELNCTDVLHPDVCAKKTAKKVDFKAAAIIMSAFYTF